MCGGGLRGKALSLLRLFLMKLEESKQPTGTQEGLERVFKL